MNLRSVLIPVAAFAVTVTGASAFNSELLQKAGLTEDQISAFEEAKELREAGDLDAARDVLEEAGVDEGVMERLRDTMHGHHKALRAAIEDNDYEAFREAIEGSPLADIINTEEEFERFVEAHNLIKNGDKESAKEIFDDLGIEGPGKHIKMFNGDKEPPFFEQLTDEQKEELKAAFESRDHDKVKELLASYGIELPEKSEGKGFGFGRGMHKEMNND
ncbi:hypothetical protein A2837_01085 [Candidatus Kaiserbacteria bacterium RIFCSPHIGHO2_01_FULL_46_22]|uniref:DUF5667 domain-containing protein n=1 Tax=Candidatus Kaiserbacteria bacterium RIFCSPHIGHO2_01_FULL_46_22 TaxID=1798475 RepID=A0A1F6BY00_9BACT|nr:MAG: hypothetical protein A2837_01085 [Candidatus Kaiserbacteria bacterium RIFCSPHIGHO2_01_FULL_46_22]